VRNAKECVVFDNMNIVKIPDKILFTKLAYVEKPPTQNLIDEMERLMEINIGVGLAASQIGINQAFFVAKLRQGFTVCINPQITDHGREEITEYEGCLSILDAKGNVIRKPKKRWAVIDVIYFPLNPREGLCSETLKRMDARIFQHEMDHLEGRLCQ